MFFLLRRLCEPPEKRSWDKHTSGPPCSPAGVTPPRARAASESGKGAGAFSPRVSMATVTFTIDAEKRVRFLERDLSRHCGSGRVEREKQKKTNPLESFPFPAFIHLSIIQPGSNHPSSISFLPLSGDGGLRDIPEKPRGRLLHRHHVHTNGDAKTTTGNCGGIRAPFHFYFFFLTAVCAVRALRDITAAC